jgi:hypothetical protein
MMASRTVSVSIAQSPAKVYEFVSNPAHLPQWAPGFVRSITQRDNSWLAETSLGTVTFKFAEPNIFGVLDHAVTFRSGETFSNPMRVVANGEGSEVLFTVFQHASMSDAEFDKDTRVVLGDLQKLKTLVEALRKL